MTERWLPAPGLGGLYEVSSLGGFRSLRTDPPSHVRPRPNPDGYLIVTVSINGVRYTRKLHRLVCEAFHGPPNALHKEAGLLDGSRANACAANLKWVSHTENQSHKRLHGTHQAGERHPRAKLTEDNAKEIIAALAAGESCAKIAERYHVSGSAVESIRRRRNWRHLPRPSAVVRFKGQAGELNPRARLTMAQAIDIRRRAKGGEPAPQLAIEYGIGRSTDYKVIAGYSYPECQAQECGR